MLRDPDFWKTEASAPLLTRNAGFVTEQNANSRCDEAKLWLNLIPLSFKQEVVDDICPESEAESTGEPEMDRIFYQDAVRTFTDETLRLKEVAVLNAVYKSIHNYHQGLGFVVSFLRLFFDHNDTVLLTLYLDAKILKGYFKIHNRDYLRDARLFEKLLLERDPELGKHLQTYTVPGQYCSKWFIGMTVHVFPFQAVFNWFETLLAHGNIQLFKLGLAIMEINRPALMKFNSTSAITALLRFDKSIYSDYKRVNEGANDDDDQQNLATESASAESGSFYTAMIETSLDIDLDEGHVEQLRTAIEAEMIEEELERQAAVNEYSDDEIVFSDEEEEE